MTTIVLTSNDVRISPTGVQTIVNKEIRNYRDIFIGEGVQEVWIRVPYDTIDAANEATDQDVLEAAAILCEEGEGYFFNGQRIAFAPEEGINRGLMIVSVKKTCLQLLEARRNMTDSELHAFIKSRSDGAYSVRSFSTLAQFNSLLSREDFLHEVMELVLANIDDRPAVLDVQNPLANSAHSNKYLTALPLDRQIEVLWIEENEYSERNWAYVEWLLELANNA